MRTSRLAAKVDNNAIVDGFQIYLYSKGPSRRHGVGHDGVQYLLWATDSGAELQRITQRLRAHDSATYSHVENGVTFVEGCEPDRGRVIVAYPGPGQFPRADSGPEVPARTVNGRKPVMSALLRAHRPYDVCDCGSSPPIGAAAPYTGPGGRGQRS